MRRAQLEERLNDLCEQYRAAWERQDTTGMYLAMGMLVEQCAEIYRLAPPGGLLPIEDTFREIGQRLMGERIG